MKIKHALFLMLVVGLAGCSPYVLAVKETYEVATDPRSLVTQATDTQAELQIKAALLASPVRGTSGIDVYCRQGVVALVGVVPPGSQAGQAAVSIARQTSGVSGSRPISCPRNLPGRATSQSRRRSERPSSRTPSWYLAGLTSPCTRAMSCSWASSTPGRMSRSLFQTHAP